MLGRGIDQVFPVSCDPRLHEPYVRSARTYVELAERAHGPVPAPVDPAYVWGQALGELERRRPHARIVNLETAVTSGGRHDPVKGIHYRMHPANVSALEAAGVDCAVLANNHVLDWGPEGLVETLETLEAAGIRTAGAGRDAAAAAAPAALEVAGRGRVLVLAFAFPDSGVPPRWAAGPGRPGVHVFEDFSDEAVAAVAGIVESVRRPGDVVVASIHWGGNWGYRIPGGHRRFAHRLVDLAGVDLVHGHSSHHPRALEVYRDRLVLYGCGDFLTDYEGIRGHEAFRGDLVLMYFPELDPTGRLLSLEMTPLRTRRLRLERPPPEDLEWLHATMDREAGRFGGEVSLTDRGGLVLG